MLCLLAEQCWEHSLSGCSDHSDLKTWCKIKNSVSSTLSLNEDYLDICPDIDNWMLSIRRENESGKLYWVVPSTNNNRRSDNIKQQSCSFILTTLFQIVKYSTISTSSMVESSEIVISFIKGLRRMIKVMIEVRNLLYFTHSQTDKYDISDAISFDYWSSLFSRRLERVKVE